MLGLKATAEMRAGESISNGITRMKEEGKHYEEVLAALAEEARTG